MELTEQLAAATKRLATATTDLHALAPEGRHICSQIEFYESRADVDSVAYVRRRASLFCSRVVRLETTRASLSAEVDRLIAAFTAGVKPGRA